MLGYVVDAEDFGLEWLWQDDNKLSIILLILLNWHSHKLFFFLETPALFKIYFLWNSDLKVTNVVAVEEIGPVLAISRSSKKVLSLTWLELVSVLDMTWLFIKIGSLSFVIWNVLFNFFVDIIILIGLILCILSLRTLRITLCFILFSKPDSQWITRIAIEERVVFLTIWVNHFWFTTVGLLENYTLWKLILEDISLYNS